MRTIGNLIWFLFGGIIMGLAWCFFGLLALLSIVGIPWGRSCFVMAGFSFFPFGKTIVTKEVAAAARNANAEVEVANLRSNT